MASFATRLSVVLALIVSLLVGVNLQMYNATKCIEYPFILPDEKQCPAATKLLPRKLLFGYNKQLNCILARTYNASEWKRFLDANSSNTNCTKSFDLPRDDKRLPDKFKAFLRLCSGGREGLCELEQYKQAAVVPCLRAPKRRTYMTFVYECIHDNTIIYLNDKKRVSSTNPHLIVTNVTGQNRYECQAFTPDCNSNITVSVADVFLENTSSCRLEISDGKTNFASQTCYSIMYGNQTVFPNEVTIKLVVNMSKTDEKIWLEINASNNRTVTVDCGSDVAKVRHNTCTTTTLTTSPTKSSATIADRNQTEIIDTRTIISVSKKGSKSITKTSATTTMKSSPRQNTKANKSNRSIIITISVLGGVVVVATLIVIIMCCRRSKRKHCSPKKPVDYRVRHLTSTLTRSTTNVDVFYQNKALNAFENFSISDDEKIKRSSNLSESSHGSYEDVLTRHPYDKRQSNCSDYSYDHVGQIRSDVPKTTTHVYGHLDRFSRISNHADANDWSNADIDSGAYDMISEKQNIRANDDKDTYDHLGPNGEGSQLTMSRNSWVLAGQSCLNNIYSSGPDFDITNQSSPIYASVMRGTSRLNAGKDESVMRGTSRLTKSVEEGLDTVNVLDAVLLDEDKKTKL